MPNTEKRKTSFKQIGGNHYKDKKIQPWDALEDWMTQEQFIGYLLGSAVSYLSRFNVSGQINKGGSLDIQKAIHYLEKLTETVEKEKGR